MERGRDPETSIRMLVEDIQDYARSRANDVARDAETPKLAALLVQKYGAGLVAAAGIILDDGGAVAPLAAVVDDVTAKIDPDWRAHNQERWAGVREAADGGAETESDQAHADLDDEIPF